MDAYTMHLLKIAVEAVEKRYGPNPDLFIYRGVTNCDDPVVVWEVSNPFFSHEAPLLADALTALLTELGVEVPERPSVDRARAARKWATFSHEAELVDARDDVVEFLRGLYAREPLTVIAMLEGEA